MPIASRSSCFARDGRVRPSWLASAVLVGFGGFIGSALRYGLSGLTHVILRTESFPYGTVVVNVSGCFLIGLLSGLADGRLALGPQWRLFLFIGLLGGFTTFSTFGYETLMLVRDADFWRASGNVALQVAAGLLAVWEALRWHAHGRSNMILPERGYLLRIYLGESDRHGDQPLYEWLVQEARRRGLAGATVLRGMEGFGAHSRLHTAKILRLSTDLPVVVEIVDTEEKIEAFMPVVDGAVQEGLATIEKVEIRFYRSGHADSRDGPERS